MGIQGLLRNLKSIQKTRHISQYEGKRIAIDAYSWLHKFIKQPQEFVLDIVNNRYTDRFVKDIIRKLKLLIQYHIKIIMVFDGCALPQKNTEENVREKENSLKRANQLWEIGDKQNALKKYCQSIKISAQLAYRVILALKQLSIDFIVAPYQADSQLAYLSRTNQVDVVFTEDSDLLVFGAKKIFRKMKNLQGVQICLQDLKNSKQMNLTFFSHKMFMTMCILAGCDYVKNIAGIGIISAHKLVSKHRQIKKILFEVRRKDKNKIPQNYQQNFIKAYLTFIFQKVYSPQTDSIVSISGINLNEILKKFQQTLYDQDTLFDPYILEKISDPNYDWSFLGTEEDQTLLKIVKGVIDPQTFKPYILQSRENQLYKVMPIVSKNMGNVFSRKQINSKRNISNLSHWVKPKITEQKQVKLNQNNRQLNDIYKNDHLFKLQKPTNQFTLNRINQKAFQDQVIKSFTLQQDKSRQQAILSQFQTTKVQSKKPFKIRQKKQTIYQKYRNMFEPPFTQQFLCQPFNKNQLF